MEKIIEKLIRPNTGIIWAVVMLAIASMIWPPQDNTLVGMAFGILATLAKSGGDNGGD